VLAEQENLQQNHEKKILIIEVAVPSSSFSTLLATIDSFVGEGSIPA
jgi:hypothetical protein